MLTFTDLQKREQARRTRRKMLVSLVVGLLILALVIGATVAIVNEVKFEQAHVCVASHTDWIPVTVGKTTIIEPMPVCDKWVPKQ